MPEHNEYLKNKLEELLEEHTLVEITCCLSHICFNQGREKHPKFDRKFFKQKWMESAQILAYAAGSIDATERKSAKSNDVD